MNNLNSVILTMIAFFVFIGCEKEETEITFFDIQGENGFAGKVDGTNLFIGLLVAENEAIVYVCNGDELISEWFKEAIDDPANIHFINSEGAKISAKFESNAFSGQVTLRNSTTPYTFTAIPNVAADAGIYVVSGQEAIDDDIGAVWILNSEGEERGTLKIKSVFQKTPALPIRDIKDGTSNTILINEKSYKIGALYVRYDASKKAVILLPGALFPIPTNNKELKK
jgi:hypothetical protein